MLNIEDDTAQVLTATASNSVNNLYWFNNFNSQTTLPSTSTAGSFTYYVAEELIHVWPKRRLLFWLILKLS
jgi:hypothetical protein